LIRKNEKQIKRSSIAKCMLPLYNRWKRLQSSQKTKTMNEESIQPASYDQPVKIAEEVYWVGYVDRKRNLHCNPYLVVDGNEAVLIDGGSRPEFSIVMLKILQTGIQPKNILRLIYQHYDPDLCGSLPNFEDIINSEELKIISHTCLKDKPSSSWTEIRSV